ncbi:hypothetical protein SLS54_009819 [Diplodia seriata]
MARQSKRHRNRNRHSSSSTLSSLSPDPHQEPQTRHDGGGACSDVINNNNNNPPLRSGSDATPAQGYRFSTLRVAVTGAEGIEGDTVPMTQTEGDANESKSERDKRERNERAARRRSRRSDALSPTDEVYFTPLAPVVVRRPVGGGYSIAAAAGPAMTIRTKRRRDVYDNDNDSNNGETNPDVDNDDELDDQDVVAGDETPAPKRARRGAGKAEAMSATTATARALAGATGPFVARASSPSDSSASSDATVSAAASDCEEAGAFKDDRRRSITVDVAATDQQEEEGQVITSASASAALFDYTAASYQPPLLGDNYFSGLLALNERLVNDRVRNSEGSSPPSSATTISTSRFEHSSPQSDDNYFSALLRLNERLANDRARNSDDNNSNELSVFNAAAAANGNSAPRRLPPLGTISTRPYAAFDELPLIQPQSRSSSTLSSSSPPPPPSDPTNSDATNNVQITTNPSVQPAIPASPDDDRLTSTKKQRNNNNKAKEHLEILYEGRGTRRVSEGGVGAQGHGLEFGKPPTPRKSKARTRIATSMPAALMSKVATSMQGGDGKKSGGSDGEVDK